jgi:hypothetical protein
MRIGEVSARTGVGTATLRAWERRYGLLRPVRTQGGHRSYTEEDVARVRAVAAVVAQGKRVSSAAREVLAPPADISEAAEEARCRLWAAFDAFDEEATSVALSHATATLSTPAVFDEVFVPTLRRLGAEWRESPRNIAREHFASAHLRAHLVELLPAETGGGRSCLAFCPEGEQHEIGLLMAVIVLAAGGGPQIFLGARTPVASVVTLLNELQPRLVLVSAARRRLAVRFLETWRPPRGCETVAGGAGFRPEDEGRLGGRVHLGPYSDLGAIVSDALR